MHANMLAYGDTKDSKFQRLRSTSEPGAGESWKRVAPIGFVPLPRARMRPQTKHGGAKKIPVNTGYFSFSAAPALRDPARRVPAAKASALPPGANRRELWSRSQIAMLFKTDMLDCARAKGRLRKLR